MPKPFDQAFKCLTEFDPLATLILAKLAEARRVLKIQRIERELTRDPPQIDGAFAVTDEEGSEWIALTEAFTSFPSEGPERMVTYACELFAKYRLPIFAAALLLLEKYDPGDVAEFGKLKAGDFSARIEFSTVRVFKRPAKELIESGRPGLLAWVPLSDATEEEVIEAGVAARRSGSSHVASTFQLLGSLRYGRDEWERMLQRGSMMISTEVLEESWLVQDLKRMYKAEGRDEGRKEGRDEGRDQTVRQMLATLVAGRFPALIGYLPELEHLKDVAAMDNAFRRLIVADEPAARTILAELLAQTAHGGSESNDAR